MKKAFFWSFLTNYLGIAVSFSSVIILARVLTPSEIGTYAIASAIFSIAQIFRDMGISGFLLRENYLDKAKISGALAIVWILCTTIAIVIFLASAPISDFYSLVELESVLQILSFNILLIPIGTQAQTHLRRSLNFKVLGGIELVSQSVHLVVAVTFAYHSFGANSLAAASLSTTICTIVLVNLACRKQEKFLPSLSNARLVLPNISMIGFANILTVMSNKITPIVVGKVLSEKALAIMDKALATIELLNQLLIQAIQKVLLPFLTAIKIQEGDVRKAFLTVTDYTLLFALPFLFYIAVLAEFVVTTLFGNQWIEAIPLVPIFAISSAVGINVRYFNEVSVSLGLEKILMKLNVIMFVVTFFTLSIAGRYGLEPVALGIMTISFLRTYLVFSILKKHLGIGLQFFISRTWKAYMIFVVSTTPYIAARVFDIKLDEFTNVLSLSIIVLFVWLLGIHLFNHNAKTTILKTFNHKYSK